MYGPKLSLAHRSFDLGRQKLREIAPGARKKRDRAVWLMANLPSCGPGASGPVLIDGLFDNPNYWYRVALLRAALGLGRGREIGLVGPFNTKAVRRTFAAFGIDDVIDHRRQAPDQNEMRPAARKLLSGTRRPADILDWDLPDDLPGAFLYDGLLKRQRSAEVDLSDPDLEGYVADALCGIAAARRILDAHDFQLLILSHTINFTWGPLLWVAVSRGIPVIIPYGLYGVQHFVRMRSRDDIYELCEQYDDSVIDALPPDRVASLSEIGQRYLTLRESGRTDDIQAEYAFRRNRQSIDRGALAARFGWDANKPIVAFYASHWFDWPHRVGMRHFTDFADWTRASMEVARRNTDVNWLVRPHPLEERFGGAVLSDVIDRNDLPPHIGLDDGDWTSSAVLRAVDALVTYHGTAGVEFAAMGGPVLLPDRGKFDRCGFALVATSRGQYLELLGRPWWRDIDTGAARHRALVYAGLYFAAPDWQGGLLNRDESLQDALYEDIAALLVDHRQALLRELDAIRDWSLSGESHYHAYRMLRADAYQLTNVLEG